MSVYQNKSQHLLTFIFLQLLNFKFVKYLLYMYSEMCVCRNAQWIGYNVLELEGREVPLQLSGSPQRTRAYDTATEMNNYE